MLFLDSVYFLLFPACRFAILRMDAGMFKNERSLVGKFRTEKLVGKPMPRLVLIHFNVAAVAVAVAAAR